MRNSLWGVLFGLSVLTLGGCGGSEPSESDRAAESRSAEAESAAKARQNAEAEKVAEQTAVYKERQSVAGPLATKLNDLNSRLSVGLPFAKYSDSVGSAKVAYDKLIRQAKARGGVSDQCIKEVGTPLETGLNAYITAYNAWNDCVNDTYCTFDDGSPALKKAQRAWAKADRLVTKADSALTRMQPSD